MIAGDHHGIRQKLDRRRGSRTTGIIAKTGQQAGTDRVDRSIKIIQFATAGNSLSVQMQVAVSDLAGLLKLVPRLTD